MTEAAPRPGGASPTHRLAALPPRADAEAEGHFTLEVLPIGRGAKGYSIRIQASASMTVEQAKAEMLRVGNEQELSWAEDKDYWHYTLVCNHRELKNDHVLGTYGVTETAVLKLTFAQSVKDRTGTSTLEPTSDFVARTAVLLFMHGIIAFLYGFFFTELGYGASTYKELATHHHLSIPILLGGAGLVFLLYIFDFSYWDKKKLMVLKYGALLLVLGAFAVGVVFAFRNHPYLPLTACMIFVPVYYWLIRIWVFPSKKVVLRHAVQTYEDPDDVPGNGRCHGCHDVPDPRRLRFCEACCLCGACAKDAPCVQHTLYIGNYLYSVSYATFLGGIATLGVSLAWAYEGDYWWGPATVTDFTRRIGVDTSVDDTPTGMCDVSGLLETMDTTVLQEDGSSNCLAAFLLWGSQFIMSGSVLIFSVFLYAIAGSIRRTHHHQHGLPNAIKTFMYVVMFGAVGVWAGVSITSDSPKMANMVILLSMVFLVASVSIMGSVIGWKSLEDDLESSPLVLKLESFVHSNGVKALGVMLCTPVFLTYLLVSLVNQRFRLTAGLDIGKYDDWEPEAEVSAGYTVAGPKGHAMRTVSKGKTGTKAPEWPSELGETVADGTARWAAVKAHTWLTRAGHNQVESMRTWQWTEILQSAVWFGFGYFCLVVVAGKFTTLFLAWLNGQLAATALWACTLIFVGVGITMFMAPPIPGVPVYICGGVILVKSAQKQDELDSFWLGLVFAIVVCFVVKLLAVVLQQKVIGNGLGKYVGVRRAVGVNSITIRAIKRVLTETHGMSVGKTMILVGGPDWPTSVLTGIIGCDLVPMIAGTVPVIVPLGMCTAAGALQLRAGEGPEWASMASTALAMASLMQGGMLIGAMSTIETKSAQEHKALVAEPADLEVKELDDKAELEHRIRLQATSWERVPCVMKFVLVAAVVLMNGTVMIFASSGRRCFQSVDVTTVIADAPLNGHFLNVITTFGWAVTFVNFFAVVLVKIFGLWSNHAVKKYIAEQASTKP